MVRSSKKIENLPPKLKSVEHLQTVLEILNEHPDKYLSFSKIESEFKNRLNPDNKIDGTPLHNSLINTLRFAYGINDKVGRPTIDTASYLANIAQIWQTKLIDMEMFPKEDAPNQKEESYMIKTKGIEILNQLQLNENIIKFNRTSKKSSDTIVILTIFLVALAILQVIPDKTVFGVSFKLLLSTLIAICLIMVEVLLFLNPISKKNFRTSNRVLKYEFPKSLIFIAVCTLGAMMFILIFGKAYPSLDGFFSILIIALSVEFGFLSVRFLSKRILALFNRPISFKNEFVSSLISLIIIGLIAWVILSAGKLPSAGLDVIGGLIGAWLIYFLQELFDVN